MEPLDFLRQLAGGRRRRNGGAAWPAPDGPLIPSVEGGDAPVGRRGGLRRSPLLVRSTPPVRRHRQKRYMSSLLCPRPVTLARAGARGGRAGVVTLPAPLRQQSAPHVARRLVSRLVVKSAEGDAPTDPLDEFEEKITVRPGPPSPILASPSPNPSARLRRPPGTNPLRMRI